MVASTAQTSSETTHIQENNLGAILDTKENPYAPISMGLFSHQGSRSDSNDDSCDFFTVRCGFPVHGGLPISSGPNGSRGRTEVSHQQTDLIYIAVIADGVSTSQGGKEASRIATATIRAHLEGGPQRMETLSEWLEAAIQQANDEIAFAARRDPELDSMSSAMSGTPMSGTPMSTTVVVAAIVGIKLYVMHLGDSRAYLLRRDRLFQLTRDHTWTEEAIASGTITVDEAATHPARNQLRRFLGAKGLVQVDRGLIEPSTSLVEEYLLLEPGDSILLCTDGVHSRLSEHEVWSVIRGNAGYPQDSVEELVAVALNKGERDDITSILVELPLEDKALPTDSTAEDGYGLRRGPGTDARMDTRMDARMEASPHPQTEDARFGEAQDQGRTRDPGRIMLRNILLGVAVVASLVVAGYLLFF